MRRPPHRPLRSAAWPHWGRRCLIWLPSALRAPTRTLCRSSTRGSPASDSGSGKPGGAGVGVCSRHRSGAAPRLSPATTRSCISGCVITPRTCSASASARPKIADGGSDRLIDAIIPQGSAEQIAQVVRAHLDAGADHVSLQPLGERASRASRGPPSRSFCRLAEQTATRALGLLKSSACSNPLCRMSAGATRAGGREMGSCGPRQRRCRDWAIASAPSTVFGRVAEGDPSGSFRCSGRAFVRCSRSCTLEQPGRGDSPRAVLDSAELCCEAFARTSH